MNGAKLPSAESLRREVATLVFTPDRLAVVKGGPAARRAYFDRALARLFPARASVPPDYLAALAQRNAALRRVQFGLSGARRARALDGAGRGARRRARCLPPRDARSARALVRGTSRGARAPLGAARVRRRAADARRARAAARTRSRARDDGNRPAPRRRRDRERRTRPAPVRLTGRAAARRALPPARGSRAAPVAAARFCSTTSSRSSIPAAGRCSRSASRAWGRR